MLFLPFCSFFSSGASTMNCVDCSLSGQFLLVSSISFDCSPIILLISSISYLLLLPYFAGSDGFAFFVVQLFTLFSSLLSVLQAL